MDRDLVQGLDQDLNNHDFLDEMDYNGDWSPPLQGQGQSQGIQYATYQQTTQPQNAYSQQQQQYQPPIQYNQSQYSMNPLQHQQQQQQRIPYQQPVYSTPYSTTSYQPQQQQHGRASNSFVATPGFQPGSGDPSLTMSGASYQMNNDYYFAAPANRQANLSPHPPHANPVSQPQLINRSDSNSPYASHNNGGPLSNYLPSAQLQNSSRALTSSPFGQQTTGAGSAFNPPIQATSRAHSNASFSPQTSGVASPYNTAFQFQPSNRGQTQSLYQAQPVDDSNTYYQGQTTQGQQYSQAYQTQQIQARSNPANLAPNRMPHNFSASDIAAASSSYARSFDPSPMSSSTPQVILPAYDPLKAQALSANPTPVDSLRVTYPDFLAQHHKRKDHPDGFAPFAMLVDMSQDLSQPVLKAPSAKRQKKNAANKLLGTEKAPPKKRGRPPKDKTAAVSNYKGTSRPPKAATVKKLREDGNMKNSPSPSINTSSSEESSSEDESEDEGTMPVTNINSVRDATRPTNPALAAEWDAIGLVWIDPHSKPSPDKLGETIRKYVDFVLDLRAQLKDVSTQIAEVTGQPEKVNPLERQRTELLDMLFYTVHAAVKHGYYGIVSSLGSHAKLVYALAQTLRECLQTNDYGKLPKEILTLMTKFQTLSETLLARVKFEPIQKKWNKKTDEDAKNAFVAIYANTVEAQEKTRKLEEAKKAREAFDEQKKKRAADMTKMTSASTVKRPREGGASVVNPAKKGITTGNADANRKVVVKRPTGNLLNLMTRPVAKPVAKKREPSPPQESKLGALLASIAQPTEIPKAAPSAPPRAPETPEETARRERKESRRHLRVKFKEGPELEEIRLFKHEQGEDEGRQDDMLRDATDTHNEGMMHKKRVAETIDDEDDYQPPDVEEARFPEPKAVDFSQLHKATPYGPTYTTRGGDLKFTTSEQKTQSHREAVELLVIYTDPGDVPPSAKEAPSSAEAAQQQQLLPRQIPAPTEPWIAQRLQQLYYGPVESFRNFNSHHVTQESTESRANRIAQSFQTQSALAQPDIGRDQVQVRLDDIKRSSTMSEQDIYLKLQAVVNDLKGKPYPATEPPDWMTDERQRDIWWEGYYRDNAQKLNIDAEQKIQQAYQVQAPAVVPQFIQPLANMTPQQYQPQSPQFIQDYSESTNTNAAQPFDYNAWAAANAIGARGNENSRPPRREESETLHREREHRFQGNTNGRTKNFQQGGDSTYKYKKELCTYFPQGRCAKGDDCTYLHQ